jgi:hypothetical protein
MAGQPKFELTYDLQVSGPLASTKGSPLGERVYWEMTSARLYGERIEARMAMPGGDWMVVGTDGLWRPDVRAQLRTHDEVTILLHYTGLVKPTPEFLRAAEDGRPTRFEDQYLRQVMRFDTGSERYAWLTQDIFIAEGRLAGPAQLQYRIYRLT